MTDDTKKALEEILKLLSSSLQDGVGFAKQQIPLILQEKLTFDWWSYLVWTLLFTAIWVGSIFLIRAANRYKAAHKFEDYEFLLGLSWGWFVIMSFAELLALGFNVNEMLKITLAPRLYLLEWVKEFIK